MKIKIEIELVELAKDYYYFSACNIPYRVWKEDDCWYTMTFSGSTLEAYATLEDAVNDLINSQWIDDSYKKVV